MAENIDYWESVLQKLPDSYKTWFAAERAYLHERIRPDASVLEIGCGEGRSIADMLSVTTHITGIDYDIKAIEHAQQKFGTHPDITLQVADAATLPFPDRSFDHVVCLTTFANFAEKKYKVLAEMRRTLRDDGTIVISVFADNAFEERMKVYKASNIPILELRGTTAVLAGPVFSEQFSREELETILTKADFHVDDIRQVSIAHLCTASKAQP